MKFKVFDPEKKKKKEEIVYLKLVEQNSDVMLIVCNKYGERFSSNNLLVFEDDGTVRKCSYVNESLGLLLDECCRLIIEE